MNGLQAPQAGASLSSCIRSSSSALQEDKVLLSARKHKLQCLHEQQQRVRQGPSAPGLLPQALDMAQLCFDDSAVSAARKRHLQVLSFVPSAPAKPGCTECQDHKKLAGYCRPLQCMEWQMLLLHCWASLLPDCCVIGMACSAVLLCCQQQGKQQSCCTALSPSPSILPAPLFFCDWHQALRPATFHG